MSQKIMIEFGTKIDTAQTVAAAKKMQQIIQNSSTGTSMKTSAEAQLKTVNEYAKKIERMNSQPKISQNDFNQLKIWTNLMNDSASRIGDIYSKAGASLSVEMSKALAELNELQSKSQATIKSIKSVYAKKAGVSFQNTPETLKVDQAEIDSLKASKLKVMQDASDKETAILQEQNVNREKEIKETKDRQLKTYKETYDIDLKNFTEYEVEKTRINKELNSIVIKTNEVIKKSAPAQAKLNRENITEINSKEGISKYERNKQLIALNIPGVNNKTTANTYLNQGLATNTQEIIKQQTQIKELDKQRQVDLKKQEALLNEQSKELDLIVKKNIILTEEQVTGKATAVGVAVGQKIDTDVQNKETKLQGTKDLSSAAALAISTEELNLQNVSLVKNSEINKIATKDQKVNTAETNEATIAKEALDDELNKNTNTIANYNNQSEKAILKQKMFGKMTDSLASTLTRVTSAFYLFYKAQQMVGKAVSTLTTLDDEITQIGIVTNKTGKEIWTNFPMFNKLAMDLSTTTAKYLEGAKIFYQQGLSTTEVIGMVAATTKIAAISEVNFEEASKTLTAAIRGYNMETTQAAAVTDKLAAVGAASAADFHELSVAMEKVSAAAYTAGMSFDSLMGVLAKGIETSREAPEAIGTALKTIIARFQEMKMDPTAELEDGGNANRVEKALKSVGVALRDAHGQFRDFDDVLNDLGGKWDGLTRNQKAYIGTMAA